MDNKLSNNFTRIRRNLNIISSMILFIYFAEVKIDAITSQGMLLHVGNPEMINVFLTIILAYFLYSYWLISPKNEKNIRQLCCLKLDGYLSHITDSMRPSESRKFSFSKINPFKFWIKINLNDYSTNQDDFNNYEYPEKHFLWYRYKALLAAIFKEDYFSTYLLPYVLAYIAFIFTVIELSNNA